MGEGVVDFAGQSFAFGGDPGLVLGGGQFGAGAGEVVDEGLAALGLGVDGGVSPRDDDGDTGADDRAEHHAHAPGAGAPALRDHDHGGDDHDCDQGVAAVQQVQVQEEQREGQPGEVGADGQQGGPDRGDRGQPGHRQPPAVQRVAQQGAGAVDGGEHEGSGHREPAGGVGQGDAGGGDGQQQEEAGVEGQAHQPQDGGQARAG
ncbi:hypothetical protein [Saccharopolyspora hirsuta]|uniref:hypothetical protein n=1 Tax=Saccharopolyspora hirsuta TaxID=1837 RepID=UPI001FE9CC78|nr:hypothetical protein [Saccharopolyspora hirsuta]